MADLNPDRIKQLFDDFKHHLKNLTYKIEDENISKACLVCDRLLEWNDTGIITTVRLKKLKENFSGKPLLFTNIHPNIKSDYNYNGNGAETWMKDMFLSPRGCYSQDKKGFQCCSRCVKQIDTNIRPCKVVLPRFAIANGALFGTAPIELKELNEAELALASKARTNKHVFVYYGGAHKCMRGWHNLYENDVDGIARTLNQVQNLGDENVILCILLGPFTPLQKRFIQNNMMVRPHMVLRALTWLKHNNILYKDVTIPGPNDMPTPFIIDESENAESQEVNIEARMEYTVVFPGTDQVLPTNGGHTTQEKFRKEVIDAMDRTSQTTVISRPTPNRLIDYQGDALLRAFPLQFPYGIGLPPQTKNHRSDGKQVAISKLDYLNHLSHQSVKHFHRGDFILVLHNMYERQRAVSVAFLRCKNPFGNDSFGEHIAGMNLADLKAAIDRVHAGLPAIDRLSGQFLKSVDAVCKSMGHTNEAAKSARLKMLSDTIRFGMSAVFLTVTPDDSNCLRIQIYVQHKCKNPPDPKIATQEEVKADFDLSVQLRQMFPGLCAFDFQQITELMIEHILGWNRVEQCSHNGGGAFGTLEAWNVAIEEQSRKTLHSHWILYVKNWSKLLGGLYSKNIRQRHSAVEKLRSYVDLVLSTRLFGLPSRGSILKQAYNHKCVVSCPPVPDMCSDQDLRNLRYSHGQSIFKNDNILKCRECHETFTSQKLVENVVTNYFGSSENLTAKMRLAVKRSSGQIEIDNMSTKETEMALFMTHALTNLHASTHASSCFKKGNECRNKMPQPPCERNTRVHFNDESPLIWWTWAGEKQERSPFLTEFQRHPFDVFTNQYHPGLSSSLGCNTNVQCGMDGGHVMYITMYSSKKTQTEDRYAYALMSRSVYKYIRRRNETGLSGTNSEFPFRDGLRTLLSAILGHTESAVVSATMAWFIMRNQSRFLFSHDYAYAPFEMVLKRSMPSRIINIGANTFVLNRLHDYVYRPSELDDMSWYDFLAEYEVVHLTERNSDFAMGFSSSNHPLYKIHGVTRRKHKATPLVRYYDFPCASEFEGNIMSESIVPNAAVEKFARTVLCLFVPFRDAQAFETVQGQCFAHKLRAAIQANTITGLSVIRLQNIQNCHNMMKAGRQKDMLERRTDPLPDPINNKKTDYDEETQKELEAHIDMCLTELVADLDEDNALRSPDDPISLLGIRMQGNNNCGFEGIRAMEVDRLSRVYEIQITNYEDDNSIGDNLAESTNRHVRADNIITKARLTELSIRVVARNVSNINEVKDIPPVGSADSIQKWAEIMFKDVDTDLLDKDQKRAFEVIVSMFVLTFHDEANRNEGSQETGTQHPHNRAQYNNLKSQLKALSGMRNTQQLILFMTGPGGSGKTRVINAVLAYSKGFCKALNYIFDKRMIVVTALTGVAATLINGETLHSAAKFYNKTITTDHIQEWKSTRLVIVDEISFATSADLSTLNEKLKLLKESVDQKYGNLHMVFTGDFSQLEPVSGKPLYYETNFPIWHDWINCFIELWGQHRFKDDPEYGDIMKRIHLGEGTENDIARLNTRVIGGEHPNSPTIADLPNNLTYAVFRNQNRSAINNGVFAEHLRKTHSTDPNKPPPFHTIIIRSDDLTWASNKKKIGPTAKHTIYSGCADTDVKTTGERGKFVDLFLKLTTLVPLMYTENDDVPNGIANGTLCRLLKVVLHPHVTENDFKLVNVDGYYVRTIDASKVDYLLCKFADSDRTFQVVTSQVACKITMPIELIPGEKTKKKVRATVNRFPLLINYATTGHKLQGQTKPSLYISEWHYGANWPYVVLSRVKTLKGLFLRFALRANFNPKHDDRLTKMIKKLRKRAPQPYEPEE